MRERPPATKSASSRSKGECSYFVEASYGSIYPALAEARGGKARDSRVEQQDGKPAKKIYAITEAGRQAFISSLFEKLGEDEFRSEFLLFARFASELPASLVEQRLRERVAMIDDPDGRNRQARGATQPSGRRMGDRLRQGLV